MSKSKGLLKFLSRVDYFSTDIEFANYLVSAIDSLKGEDKIFNGISRTSSPNLCKYENTAHARNVVACHLRKTIYVAFIKEIYEEVSEYLIYILDSSIHQTDNIKRIIGEHTQGRFDAYEVLSAESLEDIQHKAIEKIYQQLEAEHSTIEKIPKVIKKLGLSVDDNIIESSVPFLQMRHIFVHSDGKPNPEFMAAYPKIKTDAKGRISLTKELVARCRSSITKTITAIDRAMIEKGLFQSSEIVE